MTVYSLIHDSSNIETLNDSLKSSLEKRSAVDYADTEFKNNIDQLVSSSNLTNLFDKFKVRSESVAVEGGYRVNHYQLYLAALLYSSKTQWTLLRLAPG